MNNPSNPKEPLAASKSHNSPVAGLAAGTLVTTPVGDKKIEDVVIGDWVLGGSGNSQIRFCEVAQVSAHPYRGPLLQITTDTPENQIGATPNHVFFGSVRPLMAFQETIIMLAFIRNEGNEIIHSVYRAEDPYRSDDYYDVDQAEDNARESAKVSCKNGIVRLANFCQDSFEFMPATNLKVSMEIPVMECNIVRPTTITSITEEQYDGLIYVLDVPHGRNFAANGVLVHDSTLVVTRGWEENDTPAHGSSRLCSTQS